MSHDVLFDSSFEESRYSQMTVQNDRDQLEKHFVQEIVINVDSVDLRDVGKPEYDGVRTTLALFNGHCQQRVTDCRNPPPKKVKKVGYVRNSFLEENYLQSKNELLKNSIDHKEIFAYHATDMQNRLVQKNNSFLNNAKSELICCS